jgi:hypothetical protein
VTPLDLGQRLRVEVVVQELERPDPVDEPTLSPVPAAPGRNPAGSGAPR